MNKKKENEISFKNGGNILRIKIDDFIIKKKT